jgi:hypothetical protein
MELAHGTIQYWALFLTVLTQEEGKKTKRRKNKERNENKYWGSSGP